MTCRDTDFTNLKPGDEVAMIYTVQSDGKLTARKDGESAFRLGPYFTEGHYNTFVFKRAPRVLKPGDKFVWSDGSGFASERTIVFIDDRTIVYDYTTMSGAGGRYNYDRTAYYNQHRQPVNAL